MQTVQNHNIKNLDLLKELDQEGISLPEYITMLLDKELLKRGVLKTKNLNNVIDEL